MKILVIGQGIAGSMLAWTLQQRGVQVHVADGNLAGASSIAAAGIINPVTGKRFVKSWRLDEFFPVAQAAYQAIEQAFQVRIWSEQPIVRLLAKPEESNDWATRCALPDYATHLSESDAAADWAGLIKPGFRYGVIRRAARVNFPVLMAALRQQAIAEGRFWDKSIEYHTVETLAREFDGVVFCEGYRGQTNPYFPYLAWQIAKGEALLIRFLEESVPFIGQMLKKTMTLVPVGENLFWAGGSYQWHYPDLSPSESEKAFILQHLKDMLAVPFEIVDHWAGVRPTVKDRRPLLGRSSIHPKVFIFNGLGTKGALLAPFWAEHFSDFLLDRKPLEKEVDIRRFAPD